ncbi:hypothetical protein N9045_01920 [bacterium]|nr:hypothetical protein [bacterium]
MSQLQNQLQEAAVVPKDVNNLFTHNNEALVITANPDKVGGESTIAVYSKLLDSKGIIQPMLADLLSNLLKIPSDGSSTKQNSPISP